MEHKFRAGSEAKKRAAINVIFIYLTLLIFITVVAFKDAFYGREVAAKSPLIALVVVYLLLVFSCFFAISRARERVSKLEITVDDSGLQVTNGRFRAKAAFEEIDRIIRRKDRGLVIYLKNRAVPFLLLTPRIMEFELLEKLLSERCNVVEGKANAFAWFNRYLWISITVIAMTVFIIANDKTVVLLSGLVMLGLLLFSAWQALTNRKNLNIRWNIIFVFLLVIVIIIKIIIVFNRNL